MQTALIVAAIGICLVIAWETIVPRRIKEGFTTGDGGPQKEPLWGHLIPTRPDVNENNEESGFITDKRYFHGFEDIQRLGMARDFCRMVWPKGRPEDESFFACALAGTYGLSSTSYTTRTVRDGFLRSRDN
jgi:hypothetical protein